MNMIEILLSSNVFFPISSVKIWGNFIERMTANSNTKKDCVPVRTLTSATGAREKANDDDSSAIIAIVWFMLIILHVEKGK